MNEKIAQELLTEMRSIKKLLVLQLLNSDVPQKQIASMLEISEATMSRMIPRGTKSVRGRQKQDQSKERNEAS